jgi:hypothetical protein
MLLSQRVDGRRYIPTIAEWALRLLSYSSTPPLVTHFLSSIASGVSVGRIWGVRRLPLRTARFCWRSSYSLPAGYRHHEDGEDWDGEQDRHCCWRTAIYRISPQVVVASKRMVPVFRWATILPVAEASTILGSAKIRKRRPVRRPSTR